MGKTESGAIWLSAERTSPYQFFQYWRTVDDCAVDMCLKFLTELPEEEIESLRSCCLADPSKCESQIRLAEEVTTLIHGADGLRRAKLASDVLHGTEISDLCDADLNEIFGDVPSAEYSAATLESEGLSLIDALALTELCKSKGEARRTIKEGGANVNNIRRNDIETKLTPADKASESIIVLRRGKRKFALVKLV